LVGIKHHTQGIGVNDPAKQVSVTAWQETHDAGAIADVLTDHNLAAHTSLGLPTAGFSAGFVSIWAGTIASIPTDWLLCNGASLERAVYTALFTAISTIYGAADGNHFNIPDLRDKFVVGAKQDDGGIPKTNLTGALEASGGATTHHHGNHALTQPVVANHTLTITQPVIADHSLTQPVVDNHTVTQPVVAAHTYTTLAARTSSASTIRAITAITAHSLTTNAAVSNHSLSTNVNINSHTFSTAMNITIDAHTLTTNVAIDAHDNLGTTQPYYAMAYIIRSA
jgi:microcystin-dependent protein